MRVLSVDSYTIHNIFNFLRKTPNFHHIELMVKQTPAGTIYLLYKNGKALSNCWMDTLATYRFLTHLWLDDYKHMRKLADNNLS